MIGVLGTLPHLILTATLSGEYYHSRLIEETLEAQRKEVACQRFYNSKNHGQWDNMLHRKETPEVLVAE